MHWQGSDSPPCPGTTIFAWGNKEAKLNAKYSYVAKSGGLSSSGPSSRPISQDTLWRWVTCAKDDSYIGKQGAGFSRCTTEVLRRIFDSISIRQDELGNVKSSAKASEAVCDLKNLAQFHQIIAFWHISPTPG